MYKRRLLVLLALIAAGGGLCAWRLVDLQLVRGGEFAALAERAMRRGRLLKTTRGEIVDRFGRSLAQDEACYELRMDYGAMLTEWARIETERLDARPGRMTRADADDLRRRIEGAQPRLKGWRRRAAAAIARAEDCSGRAARELLAERIEGIEATLTRAAALAGVPRGDVHDNVRRAVRRVSTIRKLVGSRVVEEGRPHPVIRGLDDTAAVKMRAELLPAPFMSVSSSTRRWYPHGELACHVIGRVAKVSAETVGEDPHRDDPLRKYLGDELVGVSGVEKLCEPTLRGVRGRRLWRRTGEKLEETPAQPGRRVRLALDIQMQQAVADVLAQRAENGAAVVVHVPTGDVLALVSQPTYDLNTYRARYGDLLADTRLPLLHRAIVRKYPPGSSIKPAAALAVLAEGVITPSTMLSCRGYLHVPTAFRCWRRGGHGELSLVKAIRDSCNVFFYQVGEMLGVDRLTAWMRQLGLGSKPGTGLPGESAGLVPTRQWLLRREGRGFRPGDARFMAIGQGLLLATPLQVANMMATIARDGVYLSPRVVLNGGPEQVRRDLKLPPTALRTVQEGLYRVVNDSESMTAYKYARHPTIEICGKTGTAQTERRGYNMVWFSGYAPAKNPQIAFTIVLEYVPAAGGGGGRNCGPLARQLVSWCMEIMAGWPRGE